MSAQSNLPVLQYDVLVAGGGFAGLYCARALGRDLGAAARSRVVIVAEQNFMVFQPMLAEVAGSALAPRHVVNPIRRLCPDITVLRGAIGTIDLPSKKVILQPGEFTGAREVGFKHLVLALGGIVDLSRVPGMTEHALLMKNVGDALKLRGAIIDRFEEANLEIDPTCQKRLLTFVVVGGGYSGVETAGQLLDLTLEMAASYSRIRKEDIRVILIHSGAHLLPEISESLGRYAEQSLLARGMEIILNSRVNSITASRVLMQGGRSIDTNTVISTVGTAPNPLLLDLCQKNGINSEKGRLVTDSMMRVVGVDGLWAAGDCAAVPMPVRKESKQAASPYEPRPFCPPTAQFATREGTLMGHNIFATLTGERPLKSFEFTGLGELASIGHRTAVAEILGLQFQGFIAWWLWRSIYLMKLPGLERKLRVMMDWTLDLFFPRDIALFQPRPTQLIAEMHLEKGDQIFQIGEPAKSLYVLKAGKVDLTGVDGAVVRTLKPGDQIGKQTISEKRPWGFTATAVEPTTLVSVSAKVFESVVSAGATIDEVFTTAKISAATTAAATAPAAAI